MNAEFMACLWIYKFDDWKIVFATHVENDLVLFIYHFNAFWTYCVLHFVLSSHSKNDVIFTMRQPVLLQSQVIIKLKPRFRFE